MAKSALRLAAILCLALGVTPSCSKSKTRASSVPKGAELAELPALKAQPLEIPTTTPHQDELGHVVAHDLERLLLNAQRLSANSATLRKLSPPLLRQLISLHAPNPVMGARIDLSQTLGCVGYDPIVFSGKEHWPGVCFFSYSGGPAQFLSDLKEQSEALSERGTHLFASKVGNKKLFVDKIGEVVVLSGHPTRFAACRAYIGANLLAKQARAPSLSVDLYPSELHERYAPLLRLFFKSVAKKTDHGLASYQGPSLAAGKDVEAAFEELLLLLKESEQFRASISFTQHQLRVGMSLRVQQGAENFQRIVGSEYQEKISADLIARMPKELMMLGATAIDFSKRSEPSSRGRFWQAVAKYLGKDQNWTREMLASIDRLSPKLGKQLAMGVFPTHQGPGALVFMAQTAPGVSLPQLWRQEIEGWNPAQWSADFHKNFEFRFQKNAQKISSIQLDQLQIAASPAFQEKLQSSLGPVAYRDLMNLLGSPKVVIHLGQLSHIAFAALTTHDASESSSKVISALGGIEHFVGDREFTPTAQRFLGNSFAAVVDSAPLSRWLIASSSQAGHKPARSGLQDSQLLSRIDRQQGSALLWTISAPLIPLVQEVASRKPGRGVAAR